MYEYAPEERSPEEITAAVRRFRSDLTAVGHHYLDTHSALQRFLIADFQMAEDCTDQYIADLESQRILPDARLYSEASDEALLMHRRAMYTYWLPLYRVSHESSDFRLWLPPALKVVVPPTGEHDRSCREVRSEVSDMLGRLACQAALVCPVRRIADDIQSCPPFLPLNSMEYTFFDAEKARVDAHAFIQAVADREFIDLREKRAAAEASRSSYDYIV